MTGKAGRQLVPALRTDFLDSLAASLELSTTPRGEPLATVVASICHRTLPPHWLLREPSRGALFLRQAPLPPHRLLLQEPSRRASFLRRALVREPLLRKREAPFETPVFPALCTAVYAAVVEQWASNPEVDGAFCGRRWHPLHTQAICGGGDRSRLLTLGTTEPFACRCPNVNKMQSNV